MEATVTNRPKGVAEESLKELFHAPLEDFTAARNELAKSLRSDGDAEAADWVKGQRKPSRAAWLVNQLAVRKPKDVGRLLKAGRELRAAQEEMLAGAADREKLREAATAEQDAIDSLLGAAEAIGREHGVGAQILTRVEETLRAASGDPEVAEAIEKGLLQREQRAAGIGIVGEVTTQPPARGRKKDEREATERRQREQRKLERAREKVEEAEEAVHAAELDAHSARRALDEI